MKKTSNEWFEELNEPYRSQAIENIDESGKNELYDDLIDALYGAFIWYHSKQGSAYWVNLKESL